MTERGLEITRKFKGRLVDIQHFEISTDLKTLTLSTSQATDRKPRSIPGVWPGIDRASLRANGDVSSTLFITATGWRHKMPMSTSRSDSVPLNGVEMYFQTYGEGEPLLLLHGGGGAGVNWKLIFDFDNPPAGYRLVVPDLRGHGRSTNPTGAFTFRQIAADVLALLDHLGIERTKAIGMSMGAKTLLHVATMQPQRAEAMVLVSAAPHFPEETRALMRAAAAATHSESEWAMMRQWHLRGDEQIRSLWGMASQFAADREDMSFTQPRLGAIRARTLVVHGDRDPLYPVTLAMELHAGIAGSHLWVVPNGGHGPIFGEMAVPFALTALAFLSGQWNR